MAGLFTTRKSSVLLASTILLAGCRGEVVALRERSESQERQIRQLRSELDRLQDEQFQTLAEKDSSELALREQLERLTNQQTASPQVQQPPQTPAVTPGQTIIGQPSATPPSDIQGTPGLIPQAPAFSANPEPPAPLSNVPSDTPAKGGDMDTVRRQLEGIFEAAIAQRQIVVEPAGDGVNVTLWSNMVFSQGANLAPHIGPYLRAIGDVAAENASSDITIVAFASGADALALAADQAGAVANVIGRQSAFQRQPGAIGRTADATSAGDKIVIELRKK